MEINFPREAHCLRAILCPEPEFDSNISHDERTMAGGSLACVRMEVCGGEERSSKEPRGVQLGSGGGGGRLCRWLRAAALSSDDLR